MTREDMPPAELIELRELLGILNEEELTKEQDARLQEILAKSATARQFYLQTMFFFGQLRWQAARQEKETQHQQPAPFSVFGFLANSYRKSCNFILQDAPFALFLIFVLAGLSLIGTYLMVNTFSRPGTASLATPNFVAQITATKNCRWSMTITPMQFNVGQHLQLEEGIAQITYSNGAKVLLEGPASFTVDSPNSGLLVQGKLTARADAEESRQFTIVTPNARFVDLGTEFGVMIDALGRAAVAVFTGKVNAEAKLADGRWTAPISLVKGEGAVCEGAKFISQVASRGDFPSLCPPPPDTTSSYERWLEASRELQSRQNLLAHYDFKPDPNNPKVLLNRAPTGAQFNGEIQNAAWVDGRFQGKSALEFMTGDAGVLVNIPGRYQQLTLIAWVNINQLSNKLTGILLTNDWSRPGQLHWEILNNGSPRIGIFNTGGRVFLSCAPVMSADRLNRWCMIAASIDRPNKCYFYINDKCFRAWSRGSWTTDLEIGLATIGGWVEWGNDPGLDKIRNLTGRMDELIIFQSALSAEEIQKIYEAGKP